MFGERIRNLPVADGFYWTKQNGGKINLTDNKFYLHGSNSVLWRFTSLLLKPHRGPLTSRGRFQTAGPCLQMWCFRSSFQQTKNVGFPKKVWFRISITLPVSYFPIPTAEMIVNIWNLPPELKIKGVRLKSDWYKLFINLTLLGHVTENFNF